jgi:signal transduction histidine kinase
LRTPLTSIRGYIETLLDGELDADTSRHAHVRIDADSCMHALLNVIENAIKYSGYGGIVEISVSRKDPFICVTVEDDGVGIELADRQRIFSYGQRACTNDAVRGKGVGLAIVRAILERAGGRIDMDDSALGGARFTIALPAMEAELVAGAS